MHPLVWLLWRDTRNASRRLLRRTLQPRGALAVAGLVLFAGAVGFTTQNTENFGGNVRLFGAPGLTLLVMLGAFSPLGLYFRPPDVHWLLPAPLSRTELVLFNVAIRARPAILSGLLLSLLPTWRAAGWWPAFTGYTLIFLLLQTSGQWMAVLRAWLALRVRPLWRRVLGAALFGLPLAAAALELSVRSDVDIREFFRVSRVMLLVGAPARPFLSTVVAPDLASWLLWASISMGILGAMVAHICLLPVPYREAAVQQSERRVARFARMRSGGGTFGASRSTSVARRVPMFPTLGGAGPVAWRQIQELVRNPRGVALILSIVGLVVVAVIGLPWLRGGDPILVTQLGQTGIFLVTILPLLMGDNLACDFRRDLDRMPQLKAWPISPVALAAGQIAPAALFVTAVQAVGVLAVYLATRSVTIGVAFLVLAILPVVSWVAICLDNLLFLWLPYRTVPEDPGDVGFVGRTFATALLKFAVLSVILGLALGLGVVWLRITASPALAVGIPVATLVAGCFFGTLAVADAFRRYDVSRHAPV